MRYPDDGTDVSRDAGHANQPRVPGGVLGGLNEGGAPSGPATALEDPYTCKRLKTSYVVYIDVDVRCRYEDINICITIYTS